MTMTYMMYKQLKLERVIIRFLAVHIIKAAEELHVSPACMLQKVEAELTTTINEESKDGDDTSI